MTFGRGTTILFDRRGERVYVDDRLSKFGICILRLRTLRYDVTDCDLMQWTMNLRNWISETILVPLVKEIDDKNDKLRRTGHGDSLIGWLYILYFILWISWI